MNPCYRRILVTCRQSLLSTTRRGHRRGIFASAANHCRLRSFSASVESQAGADKGGFDRISAQGLNLNLNLKPLVVQGRIDDADAAGQGEAGGGEADQLGGEEEPSPGDCCVGVVGRESSDGEMEREAWGLLRKAVVSYCGTPVGTVAANDPAHCQPLNYDQVFIRDFIPSAIAFLLNGEGDIVRNFLLHTLQLQVHFFFTCFIHYMDF